MLHHNMHIFVRVLSPDTRKSKKPRIDLGIGNTVLLIFHWPVHEPIGRTNIRTIL